MVWGRSVGEVVLGDDGQPRLLRGTTLDITAGKTAEEDLRRTSARDRLLQAMATTANRTSRFEEVLHLAVPEINAHTGWSLGPVHLVSQDHRQLVASPWHARSPRDQQALDELPTEQRAGVATLVQQVLAVRRPLSLVLDPRRPSWGCGRRSPSRCWPEARWSRSSCWHP